MKLSDLASTSSRRAALLSLAAACSVSMPVLPAVAKFDGEANIAAPALIPSPFRPTGEMAKTCEVVALGREDVCLEPKKLLTAYDQFQLDKAKSCLMEPRAGLSEELTAILAQVGAFAPLIEQNEFKELKKAAAAFDASKLAELAGNPVQQGLIDDIKKDASKLSSAVKAGDLEASPIARAIIKLANDLSAFANAGMAEAALNG